MNHAADLLWIHPPCFTFTMLYPMVSIATRLYNSYPTSKNLISSETLGENDNDHKSCMFDCHGVWPLQFDCSSYCRGLVHLSYNTCWVLILWVFLLRRRNKRFFVIFLSFNLVKIELFHFIKWYDFCSYFIPRFSFFICFSWYINLRCLFDFKANYIEYKW